MACSLNGLVKQQCLICPKTASVRFAILAGMTSLRRLIFAFVLMLTVPFQAWASLAMPACGDMSPSNNEMQFQIGVASPMDEIPCHEQKNSHLACKMSCSHCAACHMKSAIVDLTWQSSFDSLCLASLDESMPLPVDFIPNSQKRPPRS